MTNPPPQPFKINIPPSRISKLKQKLSLASFPDELPDSNWDLGVPLSEIKRLARAWENWDWKTAAEEPLNQYPQYHTPVPIDGFGTLDIHFLHQRSSDENAIPLLFVHGWPGSFIEVLKLLHLLSSTSSSSGPHFHIVAPSLPNFGFSEGVSKRGFGLAQYAETCQKLMLGLGYERYVTQAGDWGFWITRAVGRLYPENCMASHFNMVWAKAPPGEGEGEMEYEGEDKAGLERTRWFEEEGRGYNLEQGTKPQTLAYSLHDSPIGLLAWIYEKLHDWTDSYPWTDDEILTWVSIYYFSRAGPGAAHRIYYEVKHTPPNSACTYDTLREYEPHVPIGLAYNPKDIYVVPSTWGRTLGKVVYEARNERGGHFYAHECPELLVRDLKAMFGRDGGARDAIASISNR